MRRVVLSALLAGALASPALAGTDEDAIRERLETWTAAFNSRDAAGACDLFTPDLRYAVPEVAKGTFETMCGTLGKVLSRSDLTVRYDPPDIHEIIVSGDIAVVRLTWTLTTELGGETDTTSDEGMDIFARQPDGRWSISRFIAFTTQPNTLLR